MEKFGVTRLDMNRQFLSGLSPDIKILEVGCNRGEQLSILKNMGFKNLYGVDTNGYALGMAKDGLHVLYGVATDIPFKDNFFDMVFTSGLLIHISPDSLGEVMDEIHRCTSKYIWGFEYYNDEYIKIPYRDGVGLWKGDFAQMFTDRFPDLRFVTTKGFPYLKDDNVDAMFLLEKR